MVSKPLLALSSVILDGERERIIQHPVALGKRHAVLLDVCRILFGSNSADTLTIYARYAYLSTPSATGMRFDR